MDYLDEIERQADNVPAGDYISAKFIEETINATIEDLVEKYNTISEFKLASGMVFLKAQIEALTRIKKILLGGKKNG